MGTNLDTLIRQRTDLWRGKRPNCQAEAGVPTGFARLDSELAGDGWPRRALIEILCEHQGRAALSLIIPALRHLSREARWIIWVAPPNIPYAPGLASGGIELSRILLAEPTDEQMQLWTLEQALRSGSCSAVLAWPQALEISTLRRLQLAAETGDAQAFLFRPEQAARQPSAAALRLGVRRLPEGMEVKILKRRGGWATGPLTVKI